MTPKKNLNRKVFGWGCFLLPRDLHDKRKPDQETVAASGKDVESKKCQGPRLPRAPYSTLNDPTWAQLRPQIAQHWPQIAPK
jgi:hypothetical protein